MLCNDRTKQLLLVFVTRIKYARSGRSAFSAEEVVDFGIFSAAGHHRIDSRSLGGDLVGEATERLLLTSILPEGLTS